MNKALLTILTLGAGLTTSQAALTLLDNTLGAGPGQIASIIESSRFNGSFDANNLVDGTLDVNDLNGTGTDLGNAYAGRGLGTEGPDGTAGHTVTYNFNNAVDVGGFFFANRGGNGTDIADQVAQIEVWFGTTDTTGTATQIIDVTASNYSTVAEYDFGSNVTTDIVTLRLTGGTFNPGGDLLFLGTSTAAVPEPSSTTLLGFGGLALILHRRK